MNNLQMRQKTNSSRIKKQTLLIKILDSFIFPLVYVLTVCLCCIKDKITPRKSLPKKKNSINFKLNVVKIYSFSLPMQCLEYPRNKFEDLILNF